ncbi:uncharacterized protein EV420DRAFT_1480225 [Desarmillaria tabescens]|uniref:Ribonuclease H1 N-terminal domain-containing protein n=1 Tax=Armillaria tabescens TaxID=1929756 RepID=A0AA39KBJ6_ARMTA|nr:uncharacterized protein EV420DRAFT_1480225 [Desarmillaria tabescens]KAK0458065.1 hypothetical protein EV420DRAFT_1480225 [Desarmillaria tabescens]
MTQFSLEQLAAALSALSISVPITDAAVEPASHPHASADAAGAGPLLTVHCSNCAFPNIVPVSAVPSMMGILFPSSRSGGRPVLPASAQVPSAPIMTAPLPHIRTHAAAPALAAHLSNPAAPVNPAPVAPTPVVHAPAPAPVVPAPAAPAPGPPQSASIAVTMGPDGPWYIISKGRSVGIFRGWQNVSTLVTGVGRACFFHCGTHAAAQAAFDEALATGAVEIL